MFSSFHKLVRASLICTAFVASASQAGPVLGDSVSCGVSGGGWIVLVSDRWKTPALNELGAAFYAANQRI